MPIRSVRLVWRKVSSKGRHPFLVLDVDWAELTPVAERVFAQVATLIDSLGTDSTEGVAGPAAVSALAATKDLSSPNRLLACLARQVERSARPMLAEVHHELHCSVSGTGIGYPCTDEMAAAFVLREAFRLIAQAVAKAVSGQLERQWLEAEFQSLVAGAHNEYPNEVTLGCIHRARSSGVPCRRATHFMHLYRFGDGSRQKQLWRGFSDRTGYIGVSAATNKTIACDLMWRNGLPAPRQFAVESVDDALRAAARIGFPVVVKPQSTDHGTAVETGIESNERLRAAFQTARAHGVVLVEEQIAGFDHRILVLGGRARRAYRRLPAHVVGDGARPISELIDRTAAARRKIWNLRSFGFVSKDDPQVLGQLARQGLSLNSVPAPGRMVYLRTNANISTGGTRESVADNVHPDNLRLAEKAAAVFGLDIAGIDFISPDISVSWLDNAAAICEVNPTPAMPYAEDPERLFEHMTGGATLRIPIAIVVADDEEFDTLEAALSRQAAPTPLTVARGSRLTRNGRRLTRSLPTLRVAIDVALGDPMTEALLICVSPHEASELDLGIDFADLAYVPSAAGGAISESALPVLAELGCDVVGADRASFLERSGRLLRERFPV